MLIYQVASRKATVGKKKGSTVYFAKPDAPKVLSREGLEEHIVSRTLMSRGDVRLAITSLSETIQWALSEGLSVDLPELGSFKVEAMARMVGTEGEVNASTIKKPRVRFYPKHKMRQSAQRVGIAVRTKKGVEVKGGTSGGSLPESGAGSGVPGGSDLGL